MPGRPHFLSALRASKRCKRAVRTTEVGADGCHRDPSLCVQDLLAVNATQTKALRELARRVDVLESTLGVENQSSWWRRRAVIKSAGNHVSEADLTPKAKQE
jgi:hypothetical protein